MSAEGVPASGQEDSVRSDLIAAMSQLKERDAEGQAGGGAESIADAGTVDAAGVAAQAQPGTPSRDATGKFAAKTTGADTGAQDDAGAAAAAAGTAAPVAPSTSAVKPPDGLTAAELAAFQQMSPDGQAAFSRRVADLTKKITSQDEDRTFGRKVKESAQPYAAIIAAEGSTVEQAFSSFLNYNFIMRQGTPQQKIQAIMNVARVFNVPLQQAFQQPQSGNVVSHPAIESLEQRLNRMEQAGQAQEVQRRQQQDAEAEDEINAFADDPSHVHFHTVQTLMGSLISSGAAKSLQDAYDQACYANPEVRKTLMAAEVAKQQQAQIEKAANARKAAGSVVGGPGGASPPQPAPSSTGSIRDDIKAAMAQVNSGRI